MSKPVARKNRTERVNTVHRAKGDDCNDSPTLTATMEGSSDVFCNSIGVVRIGDKVMPHKKPGCDNHDPPLVKASKTVFANAKGLARIGDEYGCSAKIETGSSNVFAGD